MIERTIEHLHYKFVIGTITAKDFRKYFKMMGDLGILHYKYPPKDAKDIAVSDVIIEVCKELKVKDQNDPVGKWI